MLSIAPSGIEIDNPLEFKYVDFSSQLHPRVLKSVSSLSILIRKKALNCTLGYWNFGSIIRAFMYLRTLNCTLGYWNAASKSSWYRNSCSQLHPRVLKLGSLILPWRSFPPLNCTLGYWNWCCHADPKRNLILSIAPSGIEITHRVYRTSIFCALNCTLGYWNRIW